MVIMNNILAAFFVLFSLSKDCESCFTKDQYEYLKIPTGTSFYKECRCTESGTGKLRWLDNDNKEISVLRPGSKSNVHAEWQDRNTYSLFISKMSKALSGVYKCTTQYNGQEHSLTFKLEAYDRPYFVQTKENQYLVSGEDSPITCEAKGDSNLIITWHKEQSLIEPDVEKYVITPNALTIKKVTNEDKGAYKCTALDLETGESIDTDIKVEVMSLPVIKDLVATPNKTVVSGDGLIIECIANGMPHPDYTWTKIPNTESSESNVTWYQTTNRIIFDTINPEDRGTYECTASNTAGNVTKAINIEVLVPPEITQFDNITALEGSTIQVVCKAKGRPSPKVTLSFETEVSDDSDSASNVWVITNPSETETELYLTIFKVNRNHAGTYICNASNEVDMIYQEMPMSVLYKPYFKDESESIWAWYGHPVHLNCEHDSNPPATISWKYQGNDILTQEQVAINELLTTNLVQVPLVVNKETMFGIYECTATNEFGSAKKFIQVHEAYPPPPVRNVIVKELTPMSITFDIDGPEEIMGPPVIGYTAQYDASENYNITDIHINRTWSKNRPFKIDRLKPNTTYYIKFAAVNSVGAGTWSEVVKFDTLEKSTPEQLIWESDSETAASDGLLKWKAPEDNGEPIDYYVVRYCPINNDTIEEGECDEERIKPTTEFQLNRLDANTTYYFEIWAHNSLGNSSAANIYVTIPALEEPQSIISAGAVIGIAVVAVLICLAILDVILFVWRRQGIIATCCYKENKKRMEDTLQARDKKGLLKDNGESVASDTLKRPDREEYKHTGIITGKHSAV